MTLTLAHQIREAAQASEEETKRLKRSFVRLCLGKCGPQRKQRGLPDRAIAFLPDARQRQLELVHSKSSLLEKELRRHRAELRKHPFHRLNSVLEPVLGDRSAIFVKDLYDSLCLDTHEAGPDKLQTLVQLSWARLCKASLETELRESARRALERFARAHSLRPPDPLAGLIQTTAVEAAPSKKAVTPGCTPTLQVAYSLLESGEKEQALEQFQRLVELHPDSPNARLGIFLCHSQAPDPTEALALGHQLEGQLEGQLRARWAKTLETLVRRKMSHLRLPLQRKKLLLELASTLKHDPDRSSALLLEAGRVLEYVPGQEEIARQLTRSARLSAEQRFHWLKVGLRESPIDDETRAEFRQLVHSPQVRARSKIARLFLTLLRRPRYQVEKAQRLRAPQLAALNPSDFRYLPYRDALETATLKYFKDRLPRDAEVQLNTSCPVFSLRCQRATPAQATAVVTEYILEAARLFGISTLRILRAEGEGEFLIDAGRNAAGPVVVYHRQLEALDLGEMRAAIYRKLLQLARGHLDLYRAGRNLSQKQRLELTFAALWVSRDQGILNGSDEQFKRLCLNCREPERLKAQLHHLYLNTAAEVFRDLSTFFFEARPFSAILDGLTDRWAAQVGGPVAASYLLARTYLSPEDFHQVEAHGLAGLQEYKQLEKRCRLLVRVQNLWVDHLEGTSPWSK